MDQLDLRGAACIIHPRYNDPHHTDQSPGLLKTWIFLKPAVEISKGKMKRVGLYDLGGVGIGRGTGNIHFLGIPDGLGILIGNTLNYFLVRQDFKKPCP